MLDLNHISGVGYIGNGTFDVFYGDATTAGTNWKHWFKPRGKSMCRIIALGGGGAGGASGAGGTADGGGAGGGSGAQGTLTLPLWALPEMLWLSVGAGGLGSNTAAGGAGIATRVSLTPIALANTTIMLCNGGGGGAVGIATAATAGTAGGVTTIANSPLAMLHGLMTTNVNLAGDPGQAGGTGAGGAGGTVVAPSSGLCVTGGAGGGGGGAFAGGFVNASGLTPNLAGGATGSLPSAHGAAGHRWPMGINGLFFNTGGSGGGYIGTGPAGNGGDGGYGSGGGGGGGIASGTRSRGGNGGPGLVIIQCW